MIKLLIFFFIYILFTLFVESKNKKLLNKNNERSLNWLRQAKTFSPEVNLSVLDNEENHFCIDEDKVKMNDKIKFYSLIVLIVAIIYLVI